MLLSLKNPWTLWLMKNSKWKSRRANKNWLFLMILFWTWPDLQTLTQVVASCLRKTLAKTYQNTFTVVMLWSLYLAPRITLIRTMPELSSTSSSWHATWTKETLLSCQWQARHLRCPTMATLSRPSTCKCRARPLMNSLAKLRTFTLTCQMSANTT